MTINKTKINSLLWTSYDTLRGGMEPSQYKDYILTFLFLKHASDRYLNEPEKAIIAMPEGCTFADIVALKGDKEIGEKLNIILDKIARKNDLPWLSNQDNDFNDINRFGKGKQMVDHLSKLVGIFEELDFGGSQIQGDKLLSDVYDYLMRNFASDTGHFKGEFYTPPEVSRILAKIVTTGKDKIHSVYDPTCGSGTLLLQVAKEVKVESFFGQELNRNTCNLARMNMLMHNVDIKDFDIHQEDTLEKPQHLNQRFQAIVANPPFSLKWRGNTNPNHITDKRFCTYGPLAPRGNASYAFLTHMLHHLSNDGVMASIFTHSVLFRGGAEGAIRQHLIKEMNVLDAVIGLPARIFYGTSIPACIFVFKKDRKANENIIFIDASGEDHYLKQGNKNILRQQDIELIVETYRNRKNLEHYSNVVSINEIENNKYDLNMNLYADSSNAAKQMDVLIEQFGDYKHKRLADVVENIDILNKNSILETKGNILYFPRIAHLKVITIEDVDKIKGKENYFKIEFKEEIVLSSYVKYFFDSDLGQLLIKQTSYGGIIQRINKDSLIDRLNILVPSLSTQNNVINASHKLERVKSSIDLIQKQLSLSPKTTQTIIGKLEGVLSSLNELSEGEQILSDIRSGESKTIEFKKSFSLDVDRYFRDKKYKLKKEDHIEHSSLKNVVGFINAEGGRLLIGVDDDGNVTGIEEELRLFHKSKSDNLLLHFKNQTNKLIGPEFYGHFDAHITTVLNKEILIVDCKKSKHNPCYLGGDFYVRTSPATDKFSTKQAHEYIIKHFKPKT